MDLETIPTTTPDPDPVPPSADAPAPSVQPESALSFRAKALQSACESLREQVKTARATNDQAGYHAAEIWLVEAERALRKAAAQCEAAETTPTVRGEV